jgi:membrane-associated phospholipid phosphatase
MKSYRVTLPFLLLLLCSSFARGQEPLTTASPSPTPEAKIEKNFIKNVLNDQKAIWTAPFHLNHNDKAWALPLTGAALTLWATDRKTEAELIEHGDNLRRFRVSRKFSEVGSLYSTATFAGAFYLVGHVTHNARARETGILAAEAMVNGTLVGSALKLASQRQRPPVDNGSGEFFEGGTSFPSGHAINAWAVATIVAREYGKNRPALKVGLYGTAAAVSIARYVGRRHFLSDVLIGSAIGYGIGRYVYDRHHDPSLDKKETSSISKVFHSKYFPRVAPEYGPHTGTYGAALGWTF